MTILKTIVMATGLLLGCTCGLSASLCQPAVKSTESTNVAVLELFTSEGCSSCPPADSVLERILREQPVTGVTVIPISESVPYWDYLGWHDPFGQKIFSDRQMQYCETLKIGTLYTPQAVINGRAQTTASNYSQLVQMLRKHSVPSTIILEAKTRLSKGNLVIDTVLEIPRASSNTNLNLQAFLLEDFLSSNVTSGENSGRKLNHSNVARSLIEIAPVITEHQKQSVEIKLDSHWKINNLSVVLVVQDNKTKAIIAAKQLKVMPQNRANISRS